MNENDLKHFKEKIEEELKLVVEELKSVGRINPEHAGDWEAVAAHISENERAEPNEVADKIEGFEENSSILNLLEIRFNELHGALKRIENDTYGKCEVDNGLIGHERLEANPAARTCKKHMN